jgi:general secretion pathway protein E
VGQIQVNPRIDLTFARALRAILRQDPDVIMIGEIRDLETAQIAVQASLTGHLVLATLHTNDAASAVTRLIDMGIEPFLLASTLRGVLAQRLVRRLCPSCRVERATTPAQRERLSRVLEAGGIVPASLWSAPGCPACNHTGSSGRGGIFELMLAHDKLAALIHNQAAEEALRTAARAHGARPLRADGLRLLAAGEASLDELLRVTED